MSPLWQFKAVSVFLYYHLPHAPSSQPFLILHFVAARETPLFSSVSHNELWRYSEACAAGNYCLCEHVRGSGYARAHLTLTINPRAAAWRAQNPTATQNKGGITRSSSWRSLMSRGGGTALQKVCIRGLFSSFS